MNNKIAGSVQACNHKYLGKKFNKRLQYFFLPLISEGKIHQI